MRLLMQAATAAVALIFALPANAQSPTPAPAPAAPAPPVPRASPTSDFAVQLATALPANVPNMLTAMARTIAYLPGFSILDKQGNFNPIGRNAATATFALNWVMSTAADSHDPVVNGLIGGASNLGGGATAALMMGTEITTDAVVTAMKGSILGGAQALTYSLIQDQLMKDSAPVPKAIVTGVAESGVTAGVAYVVEGAVLAETWPVVVGTGVAAAGGSLLSDWMNSGKPLQPAPNPFDPNAPKPPSPVTPPTPTPQPTATSGTSDTPPPIPTPTPNTTPVPTATATPVPPANTGAFYRIGNCPGSISGPYSRPVEQRPLKPTPSLSSSKR